MGLGVLKEPCIGRESRCLCVGAIFREKNMPGHARRHSAMSCANMAEQIEMPFVLWTRVGPRKHMLHGDAHLNEAAAMRLYVKLL